MRNIWAIAKKEIKGYFVSPLAYIITSVFLAISGFLFFNMLSNFSLISVQYMRYQQHLENFTLNNWVVAPLLVNMGFILLFMIPALSMRIFTEEIKSGTIELLYTSPITNLDIIIGKFTGGTKYGDIAYNAKFGFEIQSEDDEIVKEICEIIQDIVNGINYHNDVDLKLKICSFRKVDRAIQDGIYMGPLIS